MGTAGRFGGASLTQQEVFEQGLICNVEPSATLLTCFDEGDVAAAAAAAGGGRAALPRSRGMGGGQHQVRLLFSLIASSNQRHDSCLRHQHGWPSASLCRAYFLVQVARRSSSALWEHSEAGSPASLCDLCR